MAPREVRRLHPYEVLVIVDSRPSDEEVAALLTQLGEQLKSLRGDVTKVDNWGKRRLAYDIGKQREGTYAVFEVTAEPATIREFERQLKLNEHVLRFLSTRIPIRKRTRPARTQESPTGEKAPAGDKALEEVG